MKQADAFQNLVIVRRLNEGFLKMLKSRAVGSQLIFDHGQVVEQVGILRVFG